VKVPGVPSAAALLALCGSAMARPNVSGIYVASGGGTIETMQIIDEMGSSPAATRNMT
jgi:hypothetical protein